MPLKITDGFGYTFTVPFTYEQEPLVVPMSNGATLTITPARPSGVLSRIAVARIGVSVAALGAAVQGRVAVARIGVRVAAQAAAILARQAVARIGVRGSAIGARIEARVAVARVGVQGVALGEGVTAITIASLFDGGKPGIYVRPRPDTGTVWTDAGSTAAGDGDVLGQIDALAGSVASYGQTSPAAKPILRDRGAEGWLAEFDGGDDDMITNATVDFSGVSTVTFVGYVKATVLDGSIQRLLTHGTSSTGDGRLFIQAPQSLTNHFRAIMTGGGNPAVDATGATYAPPQGRVVRAEFTSANRVRLWLDGVFIGEDTGSGATFLNDNLLIGSLARALFHQGEIGSHAWIGDALTAAEASAADAEIAADHGVTL